MFSSALVCPFVCLLAGLCKNNSSNFHKLQRKGCLGRNHYILVVICIMLHAQGCRLRNDLYCVEWDVKLYYTIPYHRVRVGLWLRLGPRWCMPQEMGFHRQRTVWLWRGPDNVTHRQLLSIDQVWRRSTALTWSRWGCRRLADNIRLLAHDNNNKCDARPTVTFPACADTKFTLLGDSWLPRILIL